MASSVGVALSGMPASGKTTIGTKLARDLGLPFVNSGEIMRGFAHARGMSLLEFERVARDDASFDFYVDSALQELAASGRQYVVDSRLAWHFIPDALSCHLVTDPLVAARRAGERRGQRSEHYLNDSQALEDTLARAYADRRRFSRLYGMDVSLLKNYDLVIDTTSADTELVTSLISKNYLLEQAQGPCLWLDPKRIYPTEDIRVLRDVDYDVVGLLAEPSFLSANPVTVFYSEPHFLLLDGHKRTSSAILAGRPLIPAVLGGEGNEIIVGQLSAQELQREAFANPSRIYDWESAHEIHLWIPDA